MNNPLDADALYTIALRAAQAAARVVRASSNPEQYTGATNAGGDRVLAVDAAADAAAQDALSVAMRAANQPYAVFSEESGYIEHGALYPLFVIDPVDGSAQARRRHPDCAVSIAAAIGPTLADVVAGVVQPIISGEPYHAVRGRGAWQGESQLPLTHLPAGAASSVLIEGTDATATVDMAGRFARHDPTCQLHVSGSIALQLALLAAGCYDALVGSRAGASAYDVAAGLLIAAEAGVVCADLNGLETWRTPLTDIAVQHQLVAARTPAILETVRAVARGN